MTAPLSIALIVGGPSLERGISLNSARSIADHLAGDDISIDRIIYIDAACTPFIIDRSLLYSNTPSDFDFKLSSSQLGLSEAELAKELRSVDLVFPAIHGEFGEDGQLQQLLEGLAVPFVGSSSTACRRAFDKSEALVSLGSQHIPPVDGMLVRAGHSLTADELRRIDNYLNDYGAVVVKPCRSGSSIGVEVWTSLAEVVKAVSSSKVDVLVQHKVAGKEFTVVVLDGPSGPVALPPIEIELHGGEALTRIFEYDDKYMPSNSCTYHCPPRFNQEIIESIRDLACATYSALELRDFARIDGWYTSDGIFISDINPISGMEQNSFFFLEAAEVGLTHSSALRYVVRSACRRAELPLPSLIGTDVGTDDRQPVPIIFGGSTAERHVSVLSGTNVWLKLRGSTKYMPVPYLLRATGDLWRVPYAGALRHTVEEINDYCLREMTAPVESLRRTVCDELGLTGQIVTESNTAIRVELEEILASHPLVFLALHGGEGEDGTIQQMCEQAGVRFNGSNGAASRLCMDKYATGQTIAGLAAQGIHTANRVRVDIEQLKAAGTWSAIVEELGLPPYCVKPVGDGCSAGVVPVSDENEFGIYTRAVLDGTERLPKAAFVLLARDLPSGSTDAIEMPTKMPASILVEEYIRTDSISIVDATEASTARLEWGAASDTGWIEVTVGVLGTVGRMRALYPSLTIAASGVLSVKEKFMGGKGVNITPPPTNPLGRVSETAISNARARITTVANSLGISGYARIDAFMHCESGELVVIEANSLPGLSPSTVLFHQALAESPPLFPRDLLEHILDLAVAGEDA